MGCGGSKQSNQQQWHQRCVTTQSPQGLITYNQIYKELFNGQRRYKVDPKNPTYREENNGPWTQIPEWYTLRVAQDPQFLDGQVYALINKGKLPAKPHKR